MKNLTTKFLIIFIVIEIIFTQNVSDLIKPKCTNKKVEYSILANIEEYLENENNIDGREFYSTLDDIKDKKIGTLSCFKLDNYSNVVKYNNIDDMLDALEKHKIDAAFVNNHFANYSQVYSLTLSSMSINERKIKQLFACDKTSNLYKQLTEFYNLVRNNGRFMEEYYRWMGINEDTKKINYTSSGKNGTLKVLTFKFPPGSYKDENGDLTGSIISFFAGFASYNDYKLEVEEASSLDEINKAIQSKSYDIVNYFIENDEPLPENSFVFAIEQMTPIIRTSNSPASSKWKIYNSSEQYNGEMLGCLNAYSFDYLYKEKFPKSEVKYYDNNYDILYALLMENINGYLADGTKAKDSAKKFPSKVITIDMGITNEVGFAFKKDDNTLLNEFNQFLKTQNVEKLYKKWNDEDTSELKIEKDNYKGTKTIKAGFLFDSKPFSYKENSEIKGIEMELLYKFAKSKNYNVDLVELTDTKDRLKIGEKDSDFDIVGGHFTILEERAKIMSFSDPIYDLGTSLVVRKNSFKDSITLTLMDKEYNQIRNNKAKLYSKVGNKTLTSTCAFPDKFDYTLTIKCLIDDLNGTDPFTQGIESTTTEDKLNFGNTYLEINNILKGNELLKRNIIQESSKTESICSEDDRVSNSGNYIFIAISVLLLVLCSLFCLFRI